MLTRFVLDYLTWIHEIMKRINVCLGVKERLYIVNYLNRELVMESA